MTMTMHEVIAELDRAGLPTFQPDDDHVESMCPVCLCTMTWTDGELRWECSKGCDPQLIANGLHSRSTRGTPLPGTPPPSTNGNGAMNGHEPRAAPPARRTYRATAAAGMEIQPIRWLWEERLPFAALSMLAGVPGLGKSTLSARVAAMTTTGELAGDVLDAPRDVLMVTAEDHFQSVVLARLIAAGADLQRVWQMEALQDEHPDQLSLPGDVAAIDETCTKRAADGAPVGLIVLDPISALLAASIDSHRDASVRGVLAPLAALAERQGLAVLVVAHLNKGNATELLERVGGSVAFGAAPRSVLAFAADREGDEADRVLVHAKSNYGMLAPSLAVTIESKTVFPVGSVACAVIGEEVDTTAMDLTAAAESVGSDRIEVGIIEQLEAGVTQSSDVKDAVCKKLGCSDRTVRRAAQRMESRGEIVVERSFEFHARTIWRLAR